MFILVDTEIIEIINKPITKDVYAINEIIFLFLTRFTIEWNLNSSIPVSASNKSLVRFSQSNIKIAAKVNAINYKFLPFHIDLVNKPLLLKLEVWQQNKEAILLLVSIIFFYLRPFLINTQNSIIIK